MKGRIVTIVIAMLVGVSFVRCAPNSDIIRDDVVINGLSLNAKYSKEQICEALGQPDSIVTALYESGYVTSYHYGTDYFRQTEEGAIVEFFVTNPRFKFNNFISVGDPTARIVLLGGVVENGEFIDRNGNNITYKSWQVPKELNTDKHYSLEILFNYDNNERITKISAIYGQWL